VYSALHIGAMFCIVPFVLINAVLQFNGIEVFMGNQLRQDGLNIQNFSETVNCVGHKALMTVPKTLEIHSMNECPRVFHCTYML
jgi:hypothetical protein